MWLIRNAVMVGGSKTFYQMKFSKIPCHFLNIFPVTRSLPRRPGQEQHRRRDLHQRLRQRVRELDVPEPLHRGRGLYRLRPVPDYPDLRGSRHRPRHRDHSRGGGFQPPPAELLTRQEHSLPHLKGDIEPAGTSNRYIYYFNYKKYKLRRTKYGCEIDMKLPVPPNPETNRVNR